MLVVMSLHLLYNVFIDMTLVKIIGFKILLIIKKKFYPVISC